MSKMFYRVANIFNIPINTYSLIVDVQYRLKILFIGWFWYKKNEQQYEDVQAKVYYSCKSLLNRIQGNLINWKFYPFQLRNMTMKITLKQNQIHWKLFNFA